MDEVGTVKHVKASSNFLTDRSKAVLVLWIMFVICVSCLLYRVCSLHPCRHLMGKRWPLRSLVIFFCVFFIFPYGVLDQVWYVIVSIPGLCLLPYFDGYVVLH